MADIKINEKLVVSQTGTAEPVLASNVDINTPLANATFPTGHVIDSGVEIFNSGHRYTNSGSRVTAIDYRAVNVAIGNTIHFGFYGDCRIYYNIAQTTGRHGEVSLYHNTVGCNYGATPTGTAMCGAWGGRILNTSAAGTGDADNDSYFPFNLTAGFVATATTHYLGLSFRTGHTNARIYMYMSPGDEVVFYYNILKGNRIL